MSPDWTPLALEIAATLLVVWIVFAGIAPMLRRRRATAPARAHMSKSIAEGSDSQKSQSERARALTAAAKTALEDLRRPRLAARYAEWAHRLAPGDPEIIALTVHSLLASRRYHALERLLWASLAASSDARTSPALAVLEKLYEKQLARPDRAKALRALASTTELPPADA